MTPIRPSDQVVDAASGTAAALTGIGALLVALFPLAIPFLILTAVFAAPLVLIPFALAIPVLLLAGVVVGARAIWRRASSSQGRRRRESAHAVQTTGGFRARDAAEAPRRARA